MTVARELTALLHRPDPVADPGSLLPAALHTVMLPRGNLEDLVGLRAASATLLRTGRREAAAPAGRGVVVAAAAHCGAAAARLRTGARACAATDEAIDEAILLSPRHLLHSVLDNDHTTPRCTEVLREKSP